MRRTIGALAGATALGAVLVLAGRSSPVAQAAETVGDCEALARLSLPHVTLTEAKVVPAGGTGGHGLPAYCKVLGTSRPSTDSEIRFEVAIPVGGAWNGRYLQVGNGGFAGTIPETSLFLGLAAGYAVAGTDDGHATANVTDASWAMGHPEKVIDFGWRALKETTDAAKPILAAYEGRAAKYSYFAGCSDGGREALMEAQRYPGDFDGIVAGDPANNMTHLLTAAAWNVQALNETPQSYVPAAKLKAVEAAALKACGDETGVIENPLACRFDPAVIHCTSGDTNACLTDPQVAALRKIYAGAKNPRTGAKILDGYDPGGEGEGGGWAPWMVGFAPALKDKALLPEFGRNFFAYMVHADPAYDVRRVDFAKDVGPVDARFAAALNSNDPDLSAFRKHGGKLIQYHGWADPAIPPRDSIRYFKSVRAKMGDTAAFYRLFMAPGMLHCGGGPGPNELPTLAAISDWVEKGKAPDQLVATKLAGNAPGGTVERTRPLCPFPKVAAWDGKGDKARAESFRCVAAPKA